MRNNIQIGSSDSRQNSDDCASDMWTDACFLTHEPNHRYHEERGHYRHIIVRAKHCHKNSQMDDLIVGRVQLNGGFYPVKQV